MLELEQEINTRKSLEEKYKSLYNSITDAVLVTNKSRLIEEINDFTLKLFGYEISDLKEKSISIIYKNFDDYLKMGELLKENFIPKVLVREITFLKKDGSEFIGEVSIYPVKTDDKISGYMGVVKDITEKKLLEKQLFQTQKMESLGRFASSIAHDFNNILTVITNYADFLTELPDINPVATKYLKNILTSCEKASEITRQLLMFSRGSESNFSKINLNKILEDFKPIIEMSLGKNIALNFNSGVETMMVNGDATQIQQVLMNLVTNAKDALPEKDGKIEVFLSNRYLDDEFCNPIPDITPGYYAVITVKDNGSGIDEETLKHIFEPFFTTKPAQKGTGLGLAICYRIVKQHRGVITVKSSADKGTGFDIYIPLIE